MSKPRLIKDYDKLTEEILDQIKLEYPYGFERKLILFKNKNGKLVSALPYETETVYYLIRMTRGEAQEIIENDDDYGEDGNLTTDAKDRIEEELEPIMDEEDDES